MENSPGVARKIFLATGAALGWLAIGFQFYLIIINRTASFAETIARFFGYFTILTNILVAGCFTFLLLKSYSKWGKFFARPQSLAAIAVYIAVVGIIYNVILRFLWSPQGLQYFVDELLHTFIPGFYIIFWFRFAPKTTLQWKNILPWMIYPMSYCIYSVTRGGMVGFYPYPFIDVNLIGYTKVLVNIAGLVMVFIFIAMVFVGIAKLAARSAAIKEE